MIDVYINHFSRADYGGKQRIEILALLKLVFQFFFFFRENILHSEPFQDLQKQTLLEWDSQIYLYQEP